jgi:superfamily I DNA and/or RNA helicase
MLALQLAIRRANFVVTNAAKAAVINHFQLVGECFQPYIAIFDEAAQSTLADLYTLLSMDIKRLFLIGDKMQLTPFTKGPNDYLKYSILDLL